MEAAIRVDVPVGERGDAANAQCLELTRWGIITGANIDSVHARRSSQLYAMK
jgi:hypothetical protein